MALHNGSLDLTVLVVDATEQRIERPEKKQRDFYSGKKKCHTLKGQIVIDQVRQVVVCVATCVGKTHDFALFKDSRVVMAPTIELLGDSGYLGADQLHANSQTPHKKSKLHPLSPEQKRRN